MEIKWYGTAGLAFSAGEGTVLFDPYFPLNRELPAPDLLELAACGNIFITHGHFDHLIDVPRVIAAGGGPVFCSEVAAATLARDGVKTAHVNVIKPGDKVKCGPFKITVFRGKHIRFDFKLILQTLFSRRVIRYRRHLSALLRGARQYPAGEVLVFLIEVEGKRILHLGSLRLHENEHYPCEIDILTIPYQGRSDLLTYAPGFIRRFQPKAVYLHHFDDAFPPVSNPVDVQPLVETLGKDFPGIRVICPKTGKPVTCN